MKSKFINNLPSAGADAIVSKSDYNQLLEYVRKMLNRG